MRRSRACRQLQSALLVFITIQLAGCMSQEERARSYYERGMKLVSQHDNARAAIELRNAIRLKRDMIEAWKALAKIDETNSDWPHLVTDTRTILEFTPDDAAIRLKLGKLLLLTGSATEAVSLANAGLQRGEGDADLHALKAAAAFKLKDRANALQEAQAALRLDPTNADALMVLAIDRLTAGDAKGALSLLQGAPASGATNIGLQLLKINLLRQTGDSNSIEAILKNLVDEHPGEVEYHRLLLNFYIDQHRIADAERELRDSVATNPADSAIALDLVRFLFLIKKDSANARQELDNRIQAGGDVFSFKMALAEIDFAEGDVASAKQLLENLIAGSRTSERVQTAKVALARMLVSHRSFDQAEKLAGDILRDDPRNVAAITVRARVHLERSEPDAAAADLMSALSYQPRSTELMTLLATAYERSGLIDLADEQLAEATRVSNFDTKIGIEYANFLQRRGSPARAESVLVSLIERQPENVEVLSALAQLRLDRHNWDGAQQIADSIRRAGRTAVADQIVGVALMRQGNLNGAITALQRAYKVSLDDPRPLQLLVSAFLKAKQSDQAVGLLNSVLAKSPENAPALVLLGSIELANGATDRAIERFSAAVKAQPKDPLCYEALASVYLHQHNYEQAIKILRDGIKEEPAGTGLQITLAEALDQNGDYDGAITQYESILDREPSNLIAANNLASLLLDHRKDEPSLKKAQSMAAMLRSSQIPQFRDTLCWASYQRGDYGDAVSLCEEAAAALPDQAAVRYHLGMSYAALRRSNQASEQLKKALELARDGALAEQIRSALAKLAQETPQPR